MLETLERANLFVVPLDEERRWYRYHHLFAELLNSRLQQTQPELIAPLHRRASLWYEQHDLLCCCASSQQSVGGGRGALARERTRPLPETQMMMRATAMVMLAHTYSWADASDLSCDDAQLPYPLL